MHNAAAARKYGKAPAHADKPKEDADICSDGKKWVIMESPNEAFNIGKPIARLRPSRSAREIGVDFTAAITADTASPKFPGMVLGEYFLNTVTGLAARSE